VPSEDDPLDRLRADLRRLYVAATAGRGGRWEAVHVGGADQVHLYGVAADGGRWLIALPNRLADARLMAAARNALPLLFRALDDARTARAVPILGTVGPDGAIRWRDSAPGPVAATR
jgi:hypothetical protein